MAAIDRGEPQLSDEGSYASSAEDDVEISQKTFFFLAMAAVMAMEALLAVFKTLIRIQVYNQKDISDHQRHFLQVGV